MSSRPVAGASQPIPTVEIDGPGGRRIINQEDLPTWQRKGYKTLAAAGKAASPATQDPSKKVASGENPALRYDWNSMSIPEMSELAEAQGYKVPAGLRKPELIQFMIDNRISPAKQE